MLHPGTNTSRGRIAMLLVINKVFGALVLVIGVKLSRDAEVK
jgi:hypothetical protein